MSDTCEWSIEDDVCSKVWVTGCGFSDFFDYGGPHDNDYRFCPYCGKEIVAEGETK